MFKKIKKILEKIEPPIFLIITFILFGAIFLLILFYFKNAVVFKNFILNLIILIILYSAIFYLLARIYYQIFRFSTKKEILSDSEFKKLLKKKVEYKKKTLKKENRIHKASTKKLNQLVKEGKKLNEEFFKGAIFFKSYTIFILFSIYYGVYIGHPLLSIKNSLRYLPEAIKNFFSLSTTEAKYVWNKTACKSGEIQYHINYFPPIKYSIKKPRN